MTVDSRIPLLANGAELAQPGIEKLSTSLSNLSDPVYQAKRELELSDNKYGLEKNKYGLESLGRENELEGLKLGQAKRKESDELGVRGLAGKYTRPDGTFDRDGYMGALETLPGQQNEALNYNKLQLANKSEELKVSKERGEDAMKVLQYVQNNPSQENWDYMLDHLRKNNPAAYEQAPRKPDAAWLANVQYSVKDKLRMMELEARERVIDQKDESNNIRREELGVKRDNTALSGYKYNPSVSQFHRNPAATDRTLRGADVTGGGNALPVNTSSGAIQQPAQKGNAPLSQAEATRRNILTAELQAEQKLLQESQASGNQAQVQASTRNITALNRELGGRQTQVASSGAPTAQPGYMPTPSQFPNSVDMGETPAEAKLKQTQIDAAKKQTESQNAYKGHLDALDISLNRADKLLEG